MANLKNQKHQLSNYKHMWVTQTIYFYLKCKNCDIVLYYMTNNKSGRQRRN